MNKIRRQDKVLGWGEMHSGKQVKLMLFAEILNPRLLRNKTLKRKTNKYEFFFRNKFHKEMNPMKDLNTNMIISNDLLHTSNLQKVL